MKKILKAVRQVVVIPLLILVYQAQVTSMDPFTGNRYQQEEIQPWHHSDVFLTPPNHEGSVS